MATYEEAKEVFLKNPDGYECRKRLQKICKDEAESGKWMWEGFRQGVLDPTDSWLWTDMAETDDFTAADLVNFFEALSKSALTGFGGFGDDEPWTIYFDIMLEKVLPKNHTQFVECWRGVSAPLDAGLGFALAEQGLIEADALPPETLEWKAKDLVHLSYDRDLNALRKVWDEKTLGPAIAKWAADPDNGIWSTHWMELAWPFATTEQRVRWVLNLDYASTVVEAAAFFENCMGDAEYDLLEKKLEELVELENIQYYRSPPLQKLGFTMAAIVLGQRAMKTEKPMSPVGVKTFSRATSQISKEYLPLLHQALETIEDGAREKVVLDALKDDNYTRAQWLLVPAVPTSKVIKRAVALAGKFPKGDPYEMRSATPAFEALGFDAAQPLLDTGWNKKMPQRHLIAIGLAATKNPIVIDQLFDLLDDGLAAVQAAAIEGLNSMVEHCRERLIDTLSARKKSQRIGAAKALLDVGLTDTERETIDALRKKEKVPEVKDLLDTLAGQSGADEEQSINEFEAFAASAIERKRYKPIADILKLWIDLDAEKMTRDRTWQPLCKKEPELFTRAAAQWFRDELGRSNVALMASGWLKLFKTVPDNDTMRRATTWVLYYADPEQPGYETFVELADLFFDRYEQVGVDTFFELADHRGLELHMFRFIAERDPDRLEAWARPLFGKKDDGEASEGRAALLALGARGSEIALEFLDARAGSVRLRAIDVACETLNSEMLELLRKRLAIEKTKGVKAALQTAILQIEELALSPIPALPDNATSYADLDARFSKFDWELPKKLDVKKLSELTWNDGSKVAETTRAWILNRMGNVDYSEDLLAVRDLIDAESRHAFLKTIEAQFGEESDEGRIGWVLFVKSFGATDTEMLEFGRGLDDEARFGSSARAFKSLTVLANHGSSAALQWIDHWSRKAKSKGLRSHAEHDLRDIANKLGISTDMLSERVLSGFGFDQNGEQTIAWGKRGLMTVSLGGANELVLTDSAGKVWKNAPGALKDDDAEEIKAIKTEYSSFKKQVKLASTGQIERMEQAMVTGRAWSEKEWREIYLQNPLISNLSKHLLWGLFDGSKFETAFRVDPEMTLADLDDNRVEVAGRTIRILHPYYLSKSERKKWTTAFVDYELMPPFDQLGREIFEPETKEKKYSNISRYEDCEVGAGRFRGHLERRGWLRGSPQDGGAVCWMVKPFPAAEVTAVAYNEPGYTIGYYDGEEPQTIEKIVFVPGVHDDVWYRSEELEIKDVDPVVFSEVIRDIEELVQT